MRLLALLLLLPIAAIAQTKQVLKNISDNTLTESIVVPSGKSITINSGATITNNGTATGFGATTWSSLSGKPTTITTLADGFGAIFSGSGIVRWNGTTYALLTGGLTSGDGGTGFSTYSTGDLLYGDSTSGLLKLTGNISTTIKVLTSTGTGTTAQAPAYSTLDSLLNVSTNGFVKRTSANTYAIDTNTYLTSNQTITLSGDLTGSGSTAITTTLANSGVTAGSYTAANITVDAKGRITAASNGSSGITIGGAISGGTSGRLLLSGTTLTELTLGTGVQTWLGLGTKAGLDTLLGVTLLQSGGALGTPSSGTLTSCTGLPAASVLGGTLGGTAYTLAGGTVTTSTPLITATQTWNAAGVTFVGESRTITNTASATGSQVFNYTVSSAGSIAFDKNGELILGSAGNAGVRGGNAPAVCGTNGGALHLGCVNGNVYLGKVDVFGANLLINGPGNFQKGNSTYLYQWSSDSTSYGTADLTLGRDAAATIQLGTDAATATAQTLKAHDGSGTDKAGADLQVQGGQSTGTGTPGNVIIRTATASTTGSSANAYTTRMTVSPSGVAIGSGGAAISKVLTGTATLDFDLTAVTVYDLTITVTGAAVGDVVIIGVPNGSVTTSAQFTGWVSATNTVTIRCRTSATGENPASGTFRATVIQH